MDFQSAINWLGSQLSNILSWLTALLPDSPFKALDATPLKPYLSALNYFLPIDFILDTTLLWLNAILIYYGYSIILRWAKAIQ